MREERISVTILDGPALRSLKMLSITEISVEVVSYRAEEGKRRE